MDYYAETFNNAHTEPTQWSGHEFEECTFSGVNFSGMAITNASFVNCRFDSCDLKKATLKNTKLFDVQFRDCTLQYVDFSVCDPFGFAINLHGCKLDYAVFLNRKLKKATFSTCSMREVHFVQCDLSETKFVDCNLELAKFEENNLTQVDFSTSYNLELNPDDNKLRKAKFSLHNLPGLLTKYDLVITE